MFWEFGLFALVDSVPKMAVRLSRMFGLVLWVFGLSALVAIVMEMSLWLSLDVWPRAPDFWLNHTC